MKTLSGKVNCSTLKTIEEGAVAIVSVLDCSRMDAPAKTLGKIEIKDPKSFPFDFEVQYDETKINLGLSYGFAVSCTIEKNDQLLFINDARHSIISDNCILESVDIAVISIAR